MPRRPAGPWLPLGLAALLAVPVGALTPDELTPAEKKAYAAVAANPRAAKRYLATRDWLRSCDAVHADNGKAASLPVQPEEVSERYLDAAERKRVDDAVDLSIAFQLSNAGVTFTPGSTESFLKELGIDPKAPGVVAVSTDSVTAESGEVYTLDSLAAKRDEMGVKSFLVTRGFLYDFRNDHDSQFPDDEFYNIRYLSVAERKFMAKTLMANFPTPPEHKPAAKKQP